MEESLQLCHQPQRPPEDRISLAPNIIALNLRRQLMARVPIWPDNLSGINPVGYIHAAAQISKFSYLSLSLPPPPSHVTKRIFDYRTHQKKISWCIWFHAPMSYVGMQEILFLKLQITKFCIFNQRHLLYIWLHGSVSEQYVSTKRNMTELRKRIMDKIAVKGLFSV